ncbi:MAG: hypothetical protein V7L31_04995 [Nostoc sp.]|uniref:hypothetical protein n=1 Tax=Nostoc sp. TaxID=1180 RepID=UPI002FF009A2
MENKTFFSSSNDVIAFFSGIKWIFFIVTKGQGSRERGAREKDSGITLLFGFQAPKFIYAQKQKYLFRDA